MQSGDVSCRDQSNLTCRRSGDLLRLGGGKPAGHCTLRSSWADGRQHSRIRASHWLGVCCLVVGAFLFDDSVFVWMPVRSFHPYGLLVWLSPQGMGAMMVKRLPRYTLYSAAFIGLIGCGDNVSPARNAPDMSVTQAGEGSEGPAGPMGAMGSPGAQVSQAVTVGTGLWARRGRTVRLDHLGLKGNRVCPGNADPKGARRTRSAR